jgi:hypothetical protein
MALQVCLVCFNRLIGSKNFSCFSKRSEMKSTLASAPNASASITSRSISEIADAPDEIQYNLSFCSILNGLMKPTIASYQRWVRADFDVR